MSIKIVRQNTTLSKTVYNQKVLIFQGFQAFGYGAGSSIFSFLYKHTKID